MWKGAIPTVGKRNFPLLFPTVGTCNVSHPCENLIPTPCMQSLGCILFSVNNSFPRKGLPDSHWKFRNIIEREWHIPMVGIAWFTLKFHAVWMTHSYGRNILLNSHECEKGDSYGRKTWFPTPFSYRRNVQCLTSVWNLIPTLCMQSLRCTIQCEKNIPMVGIAGFTLKVLQCEWPITTVGIA